jgi:hypothetical protein
MRGVGLGLEGLGMGMRQVFRSGGFEELTRLMIGYFG